MPILKKRVNFLDTEVGLQIKQQLMQMTTDPTFNTESSYSSDSEAYNDNLIPFVDKHVNYLIAHPSVEPQKYMANLRLMTRKR